MKIGDTKNRNGNLISQNYLFPFLDVSILGYNVYISNNKIEFLYNIKWFCL
jgi:hypothetical protein